MMQEISLNILDLAQNSLTAGADLIEIRVDERPESDRLKVCIRDNGRGMTPEQVRRVTDPFYTTRTTRPVGLGVPFFKMAAEMTGGRFTVVSVPGKGTAVIAQFVPSHVDCMPLGDVSDTIGTLIACNPDVNFRYMRRLGGRKFVLDTREMRRILGDVPLNAPDVTVFVQEYLRSGEEEIRNE